ncbi:hypothetical protein TNCV_1824251 [Trichonephila clavipes]|nr:hypothetical protein TNCV_1824251 [Trichonephila clavipes]
MENGFNLGDFRKMKRYDQKAYKLPPPNPALVPAETNKRPLEEQPGLSSKRNRLFITPVIRSRVAPVLIARPSTALDTPQPLSIPESPVQIPPEQMSHVQISPVQIPPELTTPLVQIPDPSVQLFLPDPPPVHVFLPDPPVVETLEPTLSDDSSIDQIMSSVFGDCSQQGLPPAHTQEPQVLDTVPSLFDESNDLISFLDHFETGLAIEQQETPMDLTMPRLKKRKLYLSHRRVREIVDVVGRLGGNNVPWGMVGLQPWKRALEKNLQRSHEKALANRMPSDQASAHRILHCHDSQGWQRSRSDLHHRESCRSNFQAQRFSIQLPRECPSSFGTPPLPKSVPVEYMPFCVRGKFSQLAQGNRGLMVIKGVEQQKFFQELGLFAMALETLPKLKDICDGTFPNPMHESVHEEQDISCCTMHSGGWQRSRSDLPHGGPLEPPYDLQRQPSQQVLLPGSVPLEYLSLCVRGKFCHMAQGNRGLIVVKGSVQRKNFEKLGLFTINLKILPYFRDLNDHLHDEVHEVYDISECTMESYRFALYLQHFNKL